MRFELLHPRGLCPSIGILDTQDRFWQLGFVPSYGTEISGKMQNRRLRLRSISNGDRVLLWLK